MEIAYKVLQKMLVVPSERWIKIGGNIKWEGYKKENIQVDQKWHQNVRIENLMQYAL